MSMTTATLDKPAGYAKGDKVTLTVVDTTRSTSTTGNVPSPAGPLPFTLIVESPDAAPVCGSYVFTLVSDNPATSTTVWTTTA